MLDIPTGVRWAYARNKWARDFYHFKNLIATPAVGSFVMPANAWVGLKGGSLTLTINGTRLITSPAAPIDQIYNLAWVERGKTIVSASTVYVFDEWTNPYPILN
jgi:hypothetical protein